MNRSLFAGLCALAAGLAGGTSATAQCPPYGCRGLCMLTSACMFKHGPLVNYSAGTWYNAGGYGNGYGGAGGCGHGGCGRDGRFGHGDGIGGHAGLFHRNAGCDTCGTGHGGFLSHIGHRRGDGCNTCGHSHGTSFGTIRARLHLGHGCDKGCGDTCGDACGSATTACGTSTTACGSDGFKHHLGGRLGHKDGCDDGCHGWGRLRGRLGLGDGCCGGGLFGRHGDGCGLFGRHGGGGLFGKHGCGNGGCGNGGCGGLFCLFQCNGSGFGNCNICIGGHANYQGYGRQVARGGLNAGPWYLYWPTPDGQLQVPGPNAAGWAGNHFVMPAPYGAYSQAAGANPYFSAAAGVNPYFPSSGGGNPYFPAANPPVR